MGTYNKSVLRPTNRTKILSKKLFAFKENHDCITVNKEKGVIYLRYGKYDFSYGGYAGTQKAKKLSFSEKILILDTRYGLSPQFVVTENTINPGFSLETLNVNEVDKVKEKLDLAVEKHKSFKKMLDQLPKVPEGYLGWYEIEKIPINY